jgi:acyl-coenzyme A thioesterase PaaI-like protein
LHLPPGYALAPLDEGFLNLIGPLYGAQDRDGVWVIALRAGSRHANRYGVVHGGLLSTLADVAIGMNLSRAGATYTDAFTVQLSMDFLGHCRVGEWVEAHVALTKVQGKVRFGDCRLMVGDRMVARGSAVFYAK